MLDLMALMDRKVNLEKLGLADPLVLGQMDPPDHLGLEDFREKLEKLDHLVPWV